jgi:hypothetical protein
MNEEDGEIERYKDRERERERATMVAVKDDTEKHGIDANSGAATPGMR